MRTLYRSILVYVALACGACTNPAPPLPASEAATREPRVFGASCESATPKAVPPMVPEPEAVRGARVQARLGACRGASPPEEGSCDDQLTGWYALAYDLDVVYQDEAADATPAYDPGRGRLRMSFKAALRGACEDEPVGLTSLQLCGLTLPPLTSAAEGGWHALTVPSEAWDQPTQPQYETRVHAADTMNMDPTRILLGIEPQTHGGDWPTFLDTTSFDCGAERQGVACFPDHDGDGEPGISVQVPQSSDANAADDCGSWHLTGVRTEGTLFASEPRASTLYLGLRTALKGQFAFDETCEGGVGEAEADDVALRVFDCKLNSGGRCNALQATYVDQHAPTFHVLHAGQDPLERMPSRAATTHAPIDLRPSQGGFLTAKRLAAAEDSVSCQDVRTALGTAAVD